MNEVYTSIPEERQPVVAYAERDRVFKYLFERRGEWTTARNISNMLGISSKDTAVHLRKIITELIEFDGIPIIANSRGFKLSNDKQQLIDYAESLSLRQKGIQRRIDGIQRCIDSKILEKKRWWKE